MNVEKEWNVGCMWIVIEKQVNVSVKKADNVWKMGLKY
jgi:hypothetical protein